MSMLIIGSIEGKPLQYAWIIKSEEESIQLGNFWLRISYNWLKNHIDTENHKILFGHYDDYRYLNEDFSLWDYGIYETKDGNHLFFIRGWYSIDNNIRVKGKDYREKEVLTEDEMYKCKKLYEKEKPDVVVTSTAPAQYLEVDDNPMANFFDELLEIHRPNLWVSSNKVNIIQANESMEYRWIKPKETFTINFDKYVEWGEDK